MDIDGTLITAMAATDVIKAAAVIKVEKESMKAHRVDAADLGVDGRMLVSLWCRRLECGSGGAGCGSACSFVPLEDDVVSATDIIQHIIEPC